MVGDDTQDCSGGVSGNRKSLSINRQLGGFYPRRAALPHTRCHRNRAPILGPGKLFSGSLRSRLGFALFFVIFLRRRDEMDTNRSGTAAHPLDEANSTDGLLPAVQSYQPPTLVLVGRVHTLVAGGAGTTFEAQDPFLNKAAGQPG